mgnify:CR=1
MRKPGKQITAERRKICTEWKTCGELRNMQVRSIQKKPEEVLR